MWMMNDAKDTEVYTKTAKAVEDFCVKLDGEWAVKVEVCDQDDLSYNCTAPAKFELILSDHEREYGDIHWGRNAYAMVAIEYDDHENSATKREHYALSMEMMGADNDDMKALELLTGVLKAWVEEDCFPNATTAVDTVVYCGMANEAVLERIRA